MMAGVDAKGLAPGDWTLRTRQARAVVGVELRKILGGRRAVPVCLLAGLPVLIMLLIAVEVPSLGEARTMFSYVFSVVILGATVFFGCALVFTNLFRGEVLRRSLHFYLLSPIRREVLTVGKYAAGLLAVYALFGAVTLLSYLIFLSIVGGEAVEGGLLADMLGYLAITVLACTAYGAVFLLFGTLFRNPILPVAGLLGWEMLNFLLPSAIKFLSVSYHLKTLLPVPSMPPRAVAVLAETAPSASTAVTSLLVLSLLSATLACLRARRMEIRYSEA